MPRPVDRRRVAAGCGGVQIRIGRLNGTAVLNSRQIRLHVLRIARTVDGHVVLTLGSLHLSLHRLVVGIDLITLLGTDDTLVEETLNTVIRLLGNLQTGLRLLKHADGYRPSRTGGLGRG